MDLSPEDTITSEAALRALLGDPTPLVQAKISDHLTPLTRQFIERSPLVCLSTAGPGGRCDVSPRGDASGFVRILDPRTLLLPERPGNRLADALRNILHSPCVGLLFLIPGISDTFRVNGRATLTTRADLLAPLAVEGRPPRLGILVEIEEAYPHCARAFLRARFWEPDAIQDRASLPSSGALHRERAGDDFDAEQYDRERAARYARREGFY